ncbi:MAG: apolipoprotein N-acyltransferase [Vulcanococcus sp.]
MAENRPVWWIAAPIGGLLAGLALPPLGWPPLLWLALVPLWALGPRAAALWGALAVLVSHRWLLWLHPLDWVGVPLPLSLPLCVALLLACALLGAALVAAWRWIVQRFGADRFGTALLASALWGLAEVLLAKGPLFWIGLGSAALPGDRALAGLAQWVGGGGLAALQLLLGWGLWRVLVAWRGRRRVPWRLAMAWLLAVLLLHGLGWQRLAAAVRPEAPMALASRSVLVLQPAIPTRRKFDADQQLSLLRQLDRALAQAERLGSSVLLLPEGALPQGQPLPRPAPVPVLSGGFRLVEEQLRSALLAFPAGGSEPTAAVDKHRLVPLGEWVPGDGLIRWAGLSAVGGLSPGAPSRLLRQPQGDLAVAICYELADGQALAAASGRGAQWLLASANLDPYPAQLQHQFRALAQLRAIETDRWLVSSANTGPSLVVDGSGAVRHSLPAGRAGTLAAELQPRTRISAYGRWGERPLLLLLAAGILIALRSQVRQS